MRRWAPVLAVVAVACVVAAIAVQRREKHRDNSPPPAKLHASAEVVSVARVRPELPVAPLATVGGARVEGQVVDGELHPVTGATVRLFHADDTERTATTGADGAFVFDALPPGRIRIAAEKDDFTSDVVVMTPVATSDPVMLHLRRAMTVAVHVADASTHAPIAGAHVDDGWHKVMTDDSGTATLRGENAAPYAGVKVEAAGFANRTVTFELLDDPGAVVDVNAELVRGAAASGKVVDHDGHAIAGATVTYSIGTREAWGETTTTGADGSWHFETLVAGEYFFEASAPGLGPTKTAPVALDGVHAHPGIELHVDLDGQVVGIVLDARGQAVGGAEVELTDHMMIRESTTSDASGHFALLGMPFGKLKIYAHRGGDASTVADVELVEGRRIEMKLVIEPSQIAGTVVDTKGAPVPDAEVQLAGTTFETERSDAAGKFTFAGIPVGDYELGARRAEESGMRFPHDTHVKAGARDVKLVLPEVAQLTGRVVLAGQPMTYYGIVLGDDPDLLGSMIPPATVRAADGRFTRKSIPAGRTAVLIVGPGFANKLLRDVDVKEAQVTDLGDIEVSRGQTVHGRVTDTNGPVAGARVMVGTVFGSDDVVANQLHQLAEGAHVAFAGADGTYRIDGISAHERPPHGNTIAAFHPTRGASLVHDFDTSATVIDLKLEAVGGIDGTVTGATERSPMINAARVDGKGRAHTNPDASGAFHFDTLTAGDYMVGVFAFPGEPQPPPVRVTVVAGARATVAIRGGEGSAKVHLHVLTNDCQAIFIKSPGEGEHEPGQVAFCKDGNADVALVPGAYNACVDATACTPITVVAGQPVQKFDVPGRTN